MRSLYLRIYFTVLVALALFALVSGWLVQRHFDDERELLRSTGQERAVAMAELLQRSLPAADASADEQAAALNDWSSRLRIPLALDDAAGQRIAASPAYQRREGEAAPRRGQSIVLVDGRTLWIMRGGPPRAPRAGMAHGPGMPPGERGMGVPPYGPPPYGPTPGVAHWWPGPMLPGGAGQAVLLLVIFAAIAAGAWPVVRRLTRRLEDLRRGVEAFGAGALHQRVAEDGRDEVAALAASFNRAAARIEALLGSHRSLLANASHELRSPLARLKMAVSLIDDAPAAQRAQLRQEIHTNIGELDALVEEVLMASRLDASAAKLGTDSVDLLALAAEEAARLAAGGQVQVSGESVQVLGDERLLRRALRNLLENARRYGGGQIDLRVGRGVDGRAEVQVCDRGPGVPEAYRERIFEAFFRLPGHAEFAGGVGLGLALVRQIAQRHGGSVHCTAREGGGSCFCLSLPAG